MNTDKLTTTLGTLIGIIVAANIDWSKLISGDVGEISKLIGAVLVAIHGWATNKPGNSSLLGNRKGSAHVEAAIFVLALSCLLFGALAFGQSLQHAEYYDGGKGVVLPDPQVTPGAADQHVTQANIQKTICQHNYTAKVRHVTETTKLAVFSEYGVDPRASAQYEIDHLISLELGGKNDVANLWPQPYEQSDTDPLGAHAKDKLENWLHRQVCSGAMKLAEAQSEISHNWLAAYQAMQAVK